MADSAVTGRVHELVEPVLAEGGLELVDVVRHGSVLKVTVDRPGGIDLDAVSEATRRISDALDRDDPVAGRYLLEVSSPGVERALRTPAHFARAVGEQVTVKLRAGVAGARRIDGKLESAGDDGIIVDGRTVSYDDIQSARTKFAWPQKAVTS